MWCVSCVYGLHRLDSGVLKCSIPGLAGPPPLTFHDSVWHVRYMGLCMYGVCI